MQNPKIQAAAEIAQEAIDNLVVHQLAAAQAKLQAEQIAANAFAKAHNIVIGETVLKLAADRDLKGVVVGIGFEQRADLPNEAVFFWRCRLITKDGKLSNAHRHFDCLRQPEILPTKWLNGAA